MRTLLIFYLSGGVVSMLLALPLIWGKIPPNGIYGFRVRVTRDNPRIWYLANNYAAKRMLWSGAIFVVAAVGLYFIPGISVDAYSLACLFLFAAPFTLGLIQSLSYAKALSEQTSDGK